MLDRFGNVLFAVSCPTSIAAAALDWIGELGALESLVAKALAIVSGAIAIFIGLAILHRRRYEAEEARMKMCGECQKTGLGWHCGVACKDRPDNCPLNRPLPH